MSTLAPNVTEHRRPEDLRAEAQRLLRDGMSGRDVCTALHLDAEALRQLIGWCEDCQ
jgi:hypothetical protein